LPARQEAPPVPPTPDTKEKKKPQDISTALIRGASQSRVPDHPFIDGLSLIKPSILGPPHLWKPPYVLPPPKKMKVSMGISMGISSG